MATEFDCYTRPEILNLMKERRNKMEELELIILSSSERDAATPAEIKASDKATAKIQIIRGEMDKMRTKLKSMLTANTNAQMATSQSTATVPNQSIQGMRNYIESNVMKFDPNEHPVTTFLAELDVAYTLYITEDVEHGEKLISYFIQAAKSRISKLALQQMQLEQKSSFSTFAEFKSELTDRYSRLRTGFQLLESVWRITPNEGESMSSVATRLEREAAAAAGVIKSSYKAANNGNDMSADQAFQMMSAMRLLEFIKERNVQVYRNLVASKEPMFVLSTIANEADVLETRFVGTEDSSQSYYGRPGGNRQVRSQPSSQSAAPPTNNSDQPKADKKKSVCYNWRDKGKCNRPKCPYGHAAKDKGPATNTSEPKRNPPTFPRALYNQLTQDQIDFYQIQPEN